MTAITIALIAYFVWIYFIPRLTEHESRLKETFLVKRVIDGDTFELENGERVRLLGIDTPEKFQSSKLDSDAERTGRDKKTIRKLGELSSEYTKKLIGGKRVVLVPESNYEDKDKYGRLLRYVYLEDGTFVNRKIIEDGYANVYRRFPLSKTGEFEQAERDAREKNRGLWGKVDGLKQLDAGDSNNKKEEKSNRKKK